MDYLSSVRPSMKVLRCCIDVCESVLPNTTFSVSWLVQNNAETEWPEGTCLREVGQLLNSSLEQNKCFS